MKFVDTEVLLGKYVVVHRRGITYSRTYKIVGVGQVVEVGREMTSGAPFLKVQTSGCGAERFNLDNDTEVKVLDVSRS